MITSMVCLKRDVELFGNWESARAVSLMAQWSQCDPNVRECKPQEEIDAYLNNKMILTLENEQKYDPEAPTEEEMIVNYSKFHFYTFNPKV